MSLNNQLKLILVFFKKNKIAFFKKYRDGNILNRSGLIQINPQLKS
jgi:hypothetical protein